MFIYSNFDSRRMGPGGGIGCLIFGVLGLIAAYYILKGLFALLWWAAPVLFLLTLLIDWRVVAEAGKSLFSLIRMRPLAGILTAVLAVVAFPVVVFFLFLSALGRRRAAPPQGGPAATRPPQTQAPAEEGEFIDFEELDSRPKVPLAPPQAPEKEAKKPENPYNDLFEP